MYLPKEINQKMRNQNFYKKIKSKVIRGMGLRQNQRDVGKIVKKSEPNLVNISVVKKKAKTKLANKKWK